MAPFLSSKKMNAPHKEGCMGISKAKGFDDPAKQLAREEVWNTMLKTAASMGLTNPTALILCGPRKHEADAVLSRGIPYERLINIEQNKATMANFTRQFPKADRPRLRNHVGWLGDIVRELAANKQTVELAHLDFCEPIETIKEHSPRVEIENFIASGIMPRGVFGATVLSGRVAGYEGTTNRLKMLTRAINMRLFKKPATLVQWSTYRNATTFSPMLWAIYKIETGGN